MRIMTLKIFLVFIVTASIRCKQFNCDKIPDSFSSYQEAINRIRSSSFKMIDSILVPEGNVMKSAAYYSCDKQSGYFFYRRKGGSEYFLSQVPIKLWQSFKKSDFKDDFFDNSIKDKYTSVKISVIVE
ncbi:MAG: hypothetical protein HOP10_14995 [Chitinophagaceae bacterium]|nr:hypothetical protein [Chitinophagaceae bacterium]